MITRTQLVFLVATATLFLSSTSDAFHVPQTPALVQHHHRLVSKATTGLSMQPTTTNNEEASAAKRRIDRLSAVAIAEEWDDTNQFRLPEFDSNALKSSLLPVLSTSLLITGNTVGAGMLVLPDLAAGPGMGIATSIFVGAFLLNWVSGLLIAQVAINQHDSSGSDVPSSFKDFAEANLNSHTAANAISGISVFVNALVMAFNMAKAGEVVVGVSNSALPADMVSMGWALACVGLVGTQSFKSLSNVTSLLVTGLFVSFAGLLLPGLAHMTVDPVSLLMAPGTSEDVMASACQLAPIILMSLVYQNIVPTVTKMLGYDRTKTAAAITLGSVIPLGMYIAWAFAVVGGGVDASASGVDGPLMAVFSLTTIAGSSIGCIMSLSEEFDTFLKPKQTSSSSETKNNDSAGDKFSLPAVLASVGCAGVASQFFANDLNGALSVAGSFGSPLLYGILPVAMAYAQRQKSDKLSSSTTTTSSATNNTPMPLQPVNMGLGLLGVASTGFVGNELLQSASDAVTSLPI